MSVTAVWTHSSYLSVGTDNICTVKTDENKRADVVYE